MCVCGVCAHMCAGATSLHIYPKAQEGYWVLCSLTFCLIPLRQGFSVITEPGCNQPATPAILYSPNTLAPPPSTGVTGSCDILGFLHRSWDLNSCVCTNALMS